MKKTYNHLFFYLLVKMLFNCDSPEHPKVKIPESTVFSDDELENWKEKIEKQIIKKLDSTVYHYDTSKLMGGAWTTYRKGIIIEKGKTEEVNACFIYSGMQYYYDSTGILKQTRNYVVRKELSRSCHETGFNIIEKNYYQNGILESEKEFQSCVECDEFPAGIWKFYTKLGNIENSEDYGWREMKF